MPGIELAARVVLVVVVLHYLIETPSIFRRLLSELKTIKRHFTDFHLNQISRKRRELFRARLSFYLRMLAAFLAAATAFSPLSYYLIQIVIHVQGAHVDIA